MPRYNKYSKYEHIVLNCVIYLKGLFIVQQVTGMIHGKNSEVEESTGRTNVQIERKESTLNKAVGVSVQMAVHDES